ncbi:MAG: PASTA domain-containing protein [Atribacterota bacterium]
MTGNKKSASSFFLKVFLSILALGLGLVVSGFIGFLVLQFSANTTSLVVPDLRKQDLVSAVNQATRLGLQVEVSRLDSHQDLPPNSILEQNPAPGSNAKKGNTIRVVVNGMGGRLVSTNSGTGPTSTGGRVLPTSLVGQSKIPDVRNMTQDEAIFLLEENGFQVGRVAEVTHEEVPLGFVISQDPPVNSTVVPGTPVNLLVSKGKSEAEATPALATVPDLVGLKIDEARRLLAQTNLGVGSIEEVSNPDQNPGIILEQNPAPGQPVTAGQQVSLKVSKAVEDLQDLHLKFGLPDARVPITVKIVVKDDLGERVIYEQQHQGGEAVEISSKTKGKGKVLIYLNGYYYWEKDL